MSTAYHPQTDGKTERMNQEIEQFLRTFCAYRQDDWVRHLPLAEFALNSRVSEATGRSAFELMYGYKPEFNVSVNPMSQVPAATQRLQLLKEVQEDARAALELTAERMKRFYDHGVRNAPDLKIGDKVYLDRETHPKGQPTSKLAPKRDGPYSIVEKIGDLNYRLKLTPRDKRHPVFHVDRLRPAKQATVIPSREAPKPLPVIVEEEKEYEVEEILDSRLSRRKFQYLVKWKGYDETENSWEPVDNVQNAPEAIAEFYWKHPQAPRRVAANLFLAMNFRPIENFTAPDLRKTLDWEMGRTSAILVEITNGRLPTKGSTEAAGLDLYAATEQRIPSWSRAKVPLGIKFKVPQGTYGRIAPRSGLAMKSIDVGAGVVDRDYTGEVQVILINNTGSPYEVKKGDRVAQLIMEKCEFVEVRQVKTLESTQRGSGGFGSTGN